MGCRWDPFGRHFSFAFFIIVLSIRGCLSLNPEGLALLEFRARVDSDPYGAFANWNPNDFDPCMWSGVHCVDYKVHILDLNGLSLGGALAPELGKLSHLRSLVLYKNHFYGVIPKEIGGLSKLELLDLRENNLSGTIPEEIGGLQSLRCLLLGNNKFQGKLPLVLGRFNLSSELQVDENLTSAVTTGIGCLNRKIGHCIWQSSLKHLNRGFSFIIPIKGALIRYLNTLPLPLFKLGTNSQNGYEDNFCDDLASSSEPHKVQNAQNLVNFARRRLIEQSSNLAATPYSGGSSSEQFIALPTQSSGAFPAVPNAKKKKSNPPAPLPSPADPPKTSSSSDQSSLTLNGPVGKPANQQPSGPTFGNIWTYVIIVPVVVVLLIIAAALLFMCRKKGVKNIGPWKTGLSGQLQKAFITGVPKLNQSELQTACEDFSNIIDTLDGCPMYKGTLSSGVEIAVASTGITASKDWSKNYEMAYRKKIDTMSRVNHKNFVNLLGYCEEEEPFVRMMVFEYAPNGTVFEHLHVKEVEHLDWSTRMRIIMGTAYCLQYMHHDLNPPVAHSNLNSTSIFLTDDYAAKIAEVSFCTQVESKSKISGEDSTENSVLPPLADPETNVYSYGILLLEIISGKLPYSEEQGPLVSWAAEYLSDKRSISYMIDPTLKSFKNNELDVICEVIQECIQMDPRQRPTMRDITSKLRGVIAISPDQAVPRLSPLWWAELEILSVEAT